MAYTPSDGEVLLKHTGSNADKSSYSTRIIVHLSPDDPASSFQLYFKTLKPGCAALCARFARPAQDTLHINRIDHHKSIFNETCALLSSAIKETGNDEISRLYEKPSQRVVLYSDIKRMCPTQGRTVKFTRTKAHEPFDKRVVNLTLGEDVKTWLQEWIRLEEAAE